jgi:hypothetical protein
MDKFEKQEKRIITILGAKKFDVTRKTLETYLEYLKNHVEAPANLLVSKTSNGKNPMSLVSGARKNTRN